MSATRCCAYDEALARLRPGPRARGARRAEHRVEDVLRLLRPRSAPSRTPRSARSAWACPARCRWSTRRPIESAIRIGLALNCSIADVVPVRPEELLLPGHAEELPDLASTTSRSRFDGWTWRSRCDGETVPDRDRAGPHGGGHRQVAARRRRHRPHPRRRPLAARLQPRRRPADRDRHQADRGHRREGARGGAGLRHRAARPAAGARRLRRPDGAGLAALRRQRLAAPAPEPRSSAPAPRPRT